jgi:hypothetical protein
MGSIMCYRVPTIVTAMSLEIVQVEESCFFDLRHTNEWHRPGLAYYNYDTKPNPLSRVILSTTLVDAFDT